MSAIVLYAKDLERVATFYRRVVGLDVVEAADGFVVLSSAGSELAVVRMADAVAEAVTIADPPERRSDTPIKPVFTVPDLETARRVALACGGTPDPSESSWTWRGFRHLDVVDPEGNVLQVRQRDEV